MIIKLKHLIKHLAQPMLPLLFPLLTVRLAGKRLFVNGYVTRIPLLGSRILRLERLRIFLETDKAREEDYRHWRLANRLDNAKLQQQVELSKQFINRPLISIIVPTFNTNHEFLRVCLQSVIDQTYDNWELCIADDCSSDPAVREIIKEFAAKDKRIKYIFLDKNGHICKASNKALELADGQFVALLDHDDILHSHALFEVVKLINKDPKVDFIYSDEDKVNERGTEFTNPFFKPDWSPEYLRSVNYITHFAVLRKSLVDELGGFRTGYEGAQDWDLFLRVSRKTNKILHIPDVLYSWRMSPSSTAQHSKNKQYAYKNQRKVLFDDIKARGLDARVVWEIPNFTWRIDYKTSTQPLVSIIIPTKDCYEILKTCLNSIRRKTNYKNYEVIVVDTGSTDSRVWKLYKSIKPKFRKFRVLKWQEEFNFSSVCNYGAEHAKGEYLLFLNNDTEVISRDWVKNMLGFAQQDGVGAVGCKLLYPNGLLQHGGIILGVGGDPAHGTPGIAGHFFPAHYNNPPQDPMQNQYLGGTRNFTAVTAACIMVKRDRFKHVKGFDPGFKIAFNDVDFCLKLFTAGYRNVFLPHVNLYHHESISVGTPGTERRDNSLFLHEINKMHDKWGQLIDNDPFYHPEFRKDNATARLKI